LSLDWLSQSFPELKSLNLIGRGGQKFVYEAVHPVYGHIVLKLILGKEDILRVPREKLAVDRVNSPRVPQIFNIGTVQTQYGPTVWIQEQQIFGNNLREILNKGPLVKEDLFKLTNDLLEAIVDSEKVQIVHRDIKPENIIRDTNGEFWLIDFGLARFLDMYSLTSSANPFGVGTIGYCPPEQLRNRKKDIDSRTDLFSIGVVIYESATGVNPFREGARDPLEIADRTETQPLPMLMLDFDTEMRFGGFVATLAQKYSDQRPATAQETLDWFKEIQQSYDS